MTVDLTTLRNLAGGDPALEQELFAIFNNTARRCLEAALDNLHDVASNAWETALQELRGAAANIGAYDLVGVCRIAESTSDTSQRKLLLEEISQKTLEAQRVLQSVTY